MRSLHVAALPYPAPRGTQAALDGMLRALNEAQHPAQLLCYPEHAASSTVLPYAVHRVRGLRASKTVRSGPSLSKLVLDAALMLQLRQAIVEHAPELVVAHHVEAALCCLTLRLPVLFVAHTSLKTELPAYFPPQLSGPLASLGAGLDGFLCRRFPGSLAVSPLLAELLSAESGVSVRALSLPWSVPAASTEDERRCARRALGLSEAAKVLLYAGNFDAYQGVEGLFASLQRLSASSPEWRWLVASQSAPNRDFARKLAAYGLEQRTHFTTLADEAARRRVHAAADVVVVPRRCAGGIPIKLLDALARGVPVVATRTACAGLALPSECVEQVADGDVAALALAILRNFERPKEVVAASCRAYIARAHAPSGFVSDLLAHRAQAHRFPGSSR